MYAKALVGHEVRIGEQDGPVALWIVAFQHVQTMVSLHSASLSGVEQPEVIPSLVVALVVSILTRQSHQGLLAEWQVARSSRAAPTKRDSSSSAVPLLFL